MASEIHGLPDNNTHARNEKTHHLPSFYRGIEMLIHYLGIVAPGFGV